MSRRSINGIGLLQYCVTTFEAVSVCAHAERWIVVQGMSAGTGSVMWEYDSSGWVNFEADSQNK